MRRTSRLRRLLHRCTAVLGIALVLALNVFAASPAAHAWLHAREPDCACGHHAAPAAAPIHSSDTPEAADHDCAVVQFARAGGDGFPGHVLFSAPALRCAGRLAAPPAAPEFLRPRLFPPGCGPPRA